MNFLTSLLALIWLALPGLIAMGGTKRSMADHAAAATVSITAMMLIAALVATGWQMVTGEAAHPGLAWATTLPFILGFAWAARKTGWQAPMAEWHAFLPAAVAILIAVYTYELGYAPQADGSLNVHAWYNADWFKHLGHVHAVTNLGLPARDIFGGGEPLHYYWLFYVLPGTASAINGDAAASLYWANHGITLLFWLVTYGLLRRMGLTAWQAALLGMAAIVIFNGDGTIKWLKSGLDMMGFIAAKQAPGPVLISLGIYIPQHTLMMAILLAWALLALDDDAPIGAGMRGLTLAALVSAGAVSTLFGALCLIIYGLVQLGRCDRDSWKGRLSETAMTGVAAIAIILILRILDPGFGGDAIASPLFETETSDAPLVQKLLHTSAVALSALGPAFILGVAMLLRWRAVDGARRDPMFLLAATLLIVGLAGMILPEALMDNLRIAREVRLRAANPAAMGALLALAWMLVQVTSAKMQARGPLILLAACLAFALPSAVMRTLWHGTKGPEFFTHVPAQDMAAMAYLTRNAAPDAMLWQYPEPPELADDSSDDTWVPILAGRTIEASLRATDYPLAAPRLAAMERFFAGKAEPIPERIGWIYLSRVLHPATYDRLMQRMNQDARWSRGYCAKDACLFRLKAKP